ncbi:TIGR03617 family F420-dependent LLM class oxidoreductase [Nocardia pseudovaccinii]|uniref:TIGR03617 family F420-dependent LLM class oxidoreductase n=1 Tax=Nocardia pseudovaccinii TaxID=189540 RepID=UPI003D8BB986
MRFDFHTTSMSPEVLGDAAAELEHGGFDSIWTAETNHDPFVGLALASARTERVRLATGLAVAFARNPMSTAMIANDLQLVAKGRFTLGLGTQKQNHITRRFSMPWSAPADRMREYVLAVRQIWHCFGTGERLRFRGEFYRHTVLNPFFDPGPNPYGPPPILLAGVGPRLIEVAGEVADGFLGHVLTTPEYLRNVVRPILADSRAEAGKTLDDFDIHLTPIVVTGTDEVSFGKAADAARASIAFYATVPGYQVALESCGLGDLHAELLRVAGAGRLEDLPAVIDDATLDILGIVGTPAEVARKFYDRFEGLASSVAFFDNSGDDLAPQLELNAALRTEQARRPDKSAVNAK